MKKNKKLHQSAGSPSTDQTKHDGNIVAGDNACYLSGLKGFKLLEQINCNLLHFGLEPALEAASHLGSRANAENVCRACRESGEGDFNILPRLDRECAKFIRDKFVNTVSELGLLPHVEDYYFEITPWKPHIFQRDLEVLATSAIGNRLLSALENGDVKLRILERSRRPINEWFKSLCEHIDSGALPEALIYADRFGTRLAIQRFDSGYYDTPPHSENTSVLLRLDMLCEEFVLKEVHAALKASGINPGLDSVHIDAVTWAPKTTQEALRRHARRWAAQVMAQLK